MSQFYKKVDISIDAADVKPTDKEIISYGEEINGDFEGIKYNDCIVSDSAFSQIYSVLPSKMRNMFMPMYMQINRDIIPHIDSGVSTVINVYIKSGGYVTEFNKPKEGRKSFKLKNQTNGVSYNFDDVEILDSFVANDGDAYVLDVSKLHSVHSGTEKERVALALGTPLPFNVVCNMIQSEKNAE
jgi:hypothetical protein